MNRGFTLPELIITLAIAAILLTLGMPSFAQLIASNRVTAAHNELLGAINYTRSRAIMEGTTVTICEGTGGWGNWVVSRDSDATVLRQGNGLAPTIIGQLRDVGSPVECLVFGSVGTAINIPPGDEAEITICDKNGQGRKLSVNSIGRTKATTTTCATS